MQYRYYLLLSLMSILIFLTIGCNQRKDPEDVYHSYYNNCQDGDFESAKQYLDENAIETSEVLGVCAFTHDAINTSETQKGNPLRTFSQDPVVYTQENVSAITWIDDQGNLATVSLILDNGEWKISNATWSY